MRNLRFVEFLLLSTRERKARTVRFDPHLTILRGENDVGKSAVLKSLYATLGARPLHVSAGWKAAAVTSSLRFTLDGQPFRMVAVGSTFGLFDGTDRLLRTFRSITKDLSAHFAEIFNFRLPLRTRDGFQQATPAFLFLPFYFDQDGGWISNWSSFENLGQFQNWSADVAAFHAGVRPSEYYQSKAALGDALDSLKALQERRDLLTGTLAQVSERMNVGGFELDVQQYESEIRELLGVCSSLASKEERYKAQLLELHEQRATLDLQCRVTSEAAAELRGDLDFATALPHVATCPTCGTEHENSFAERFSIAADEDRCRDLLSELGAKLEEARAAIARVGKLAGDAAEESARIQAVLQRKRGNVLFRDVLKSQGRRELHEVIASERDEYNRKIGAQHEQVAAARANVDRLSNPEISKRALARFRTLFEAFLSDLAVRDTNPISRYRLNSAIRMSGSEQPRALLAYYFAFLHVVAEGSTSTFCPIVIDSPRQQDIDPTNWRRTVEFIAKRTPPSAQLVVSLVDTAGVTLPGTEIDLASKYSALAPSEFDEASAQLAPLIDAVLKG